VVSGGYVFTYVGGSPAGSLQAATANLSFNLRVKSALQCSDNGASTVAYEARYTNTCGDTYTIPQTFGSIAAAAGTPTLNPEKEVSDNRIAIGQPGSYTLTLSATNIANISTSSIVVTDTLPVSGSLGVGVSHASHVASAGTVSVVGRTVTWTVPKTSLSSEQTLTINFTVDDTEPCLAGELLAATATTSASSVLGCTLNA